jgi:hypothetical protein
MEYEKGLISFRSSFIKRILLYLGCELGGIIPLLFDHLIQFFLFREKMLVRLDESSNKIEKATVFHWIALAFRFL